MRPLSTRHTLALQSQPTLPMMSRGCEDVTVFGALKTRPPAHHAAVQRREAHARNSGCVTSQHTHDVACTDLPYPDQRVGARCDERFALDGKTHVPHCTPVAAFAVANFLNDVVGGAAVQ
jgi:hypothetical protein